MEEQYPFNINTPQGVAQIKVPKSKMNKCECGSDLFRQVFRITYIKLGLDLSQPPVRFIADTYLCESCDKEYEPPKPPSPLLN